MEWRTVSTLQGLIHHWTFYFPLYFTFTWGHSLSTSMSFPSILFSYISDDKRLLSGHSFLLRWKINRLSQPWQEIKSLITTPLIHVLQAAFFSHHLSKKTHLAFLIQGIQGRWWDNLYNRLRRQLYSFQMWQQLFDIYAYFRNFQTWHNSMQNSFTVLLPS